MTDKEKVCFVEKNKKGDDCVFLTDGNKVENVSKSFDDLMAMLDEQEQDDPLREELKQEILDFLNKELLIKGFCSK